MIKKNNKKVIAIYRGGNPISKVFKGGLMVFPDVIPVETGNLVGKFYVNQVIEPQEYAFIYNGNINYVIDVDETTKAFDVDFTPQLTSCANAFNYQRKDGPNAQLETLDKFPDTSNVTSFYRMFYDCVKLTSLNAVKKFNTSSATNFSGMFKSCQLLTSLDLSSFDTSNAVTMEGMFDGLIGLTSLDLSNFDTSNVKYMGDMFMNSYNFETLDLSSFDTSKVIDMGWMFYNCYNLTSLDLSNFDTSNVTNMENMFWGCNSLTSLDLSNFDISKVQNKDNMFQYCSSLMAIRCTTAFRDWCWENAETINLPDQMKNNGAGVWDLVDEKNDYNFVGEFTEDSVETDWWYREGESSSSTGNEKKYLSSKEFSENVEVNSQWFGFMDNKKIKEIHKLPPLPNVTSLYYSFQGCSALTYLNLDIDCSNIVNIGALVRDCKKLETIIFNDTINVSNITGKSLVFSNCNALNHIKCTQAFKDWCWTNKSTISLPTAMREGGTGTWEIID